MAEGISLDRVATLEKAMPLFARAETDFIAVTATSRDGSTRELVGALYHIDALKAYNRALAATAAEEHS